MSYILSLGVQAHRDIGALSPFHGDCACNLAHWALEHPSGTVGSCMSVRRIIARQSTLQLDLRFELDHHATECQRTRALHAYIRTGQRSVLLVLRSA